LVTGWNFKLANFAGGLRPAARAVVHACFSTGLGMVQLTRLCHERRSANFKTAFAPPYTRPEATLSRSLRRRNGAASRMGARWTGLERFKKCRSRKR
jgi:hypothetical protein